MSKPKSNQSDFFFSLTWEFLEEYLPKQEGRSATTIESYRDSLTVFRRYLVNHRHASIAKFKFSDCTKECIFDFRDYLKEKGNKPSTINVRVTAIRGYLNYAADKEIAVQSIALSIAKIPRCKKIEKEKEVLSENALAAILATPPQTKMGLRDRSILIALYDSAARISELLGVKLGDLSLDGEFPCVLLHGKGDKERRAQLTDKAVGHLKQYLQVFHANSPKDAYLFSTTINGNTSYMSASNVRRFIKQYTAIARENCSDIPKSVHPHMFRRTRATNLYQDGVAIELVSAILGHSQIETTKIYALPSLSQIRNAMESVPTPVDDEEPLWVGNEDEMARMCGLR
jgi:site-specific recombinase XerD